MTFKHPKGFTEGWSNQAKTFDSLQAPSSEYEHPEGFTEGWGSPGMASVKPISGPEKTSGDVMTGLKRGLQQTQAMGFGAAGLAGSALGIDPVQKWGFEGYKRNIKEAEKYPKKHSFKDVYTGEAGVGGAIDWAQGTLGELIPSMVEAAAGAAIGSFVMPGGGTAAGGLAGRTILKKAIEKTVASQIEKGIIKTGTKKALKEGIELATKNALKKFGGKVGMGAAVLPMEAGGNYGSLLEEHGIDAPGTALLFGAMATSLEYLGGNSRLIDTFIDGVGTGKGNLIKRAAKNILTNIPQEALQEGGQEVFSVLNEVVNTDEKFLTAEHIEAIIESMGAGAVGGGAGAFMQTAIPGAKDTRKPPTDSELVNNLKEALYNGDLTPEQIIELKEDPANERLLSKIDKLVADYDNMSYTKDTPEGQASNAARNSRIVERLANGEDIAPFRELSDIEKRDMEIFNVQKKLDNLLDMKKPNTIQKKNIAKFKKEIAALQAQESLSEEELQWEEDIKAQQEKRDRPKTQAELNQAEINKTDFKEQESIKLQNVTESKGEDSPLKNTEEQTLPETPSKQLTAEDSMQKDDIVSWKTKTGKEFSGKLIKDKGKDWDVKKEDGNIVSVSKSQIIGKPETKHSQEKETWEMTKDEWTEHWADEDGEFMGFAAKREMVAVIESNEIEALTEKYPNEVDFLRFLQIRKALSEGKPVPKEVLKDYPELGLGQSEKAGKPKQNQEEISDQASLETVPAPPAEVEQAEPANKKAGETKQSQEQEVKSRKEFYKSGIGRKQLDYEIKKDRGLNGQLFRYTPFEIDGVEYYAVERDGQGWKSGKTYEVIDSHGAPVFGYFNKVKNQNVQFSGKYKNRKEMIYKIKTLAENPDIELRDSFYTESKIVETKPSQEKESQEKLRKELNKRGVTSKGDISVKIVAHGEGYGVETTVKGDRRYPTESPMSLEEAKTFALNQLDNPRETQIIKPTEIKEPQQETVLSGEKFQPLSKEFISTPEGQKSLAARAGRLSMLQDLNKSVGNFYTETEINTIPDNEINIMQDILISKQQPKKEKKPSKDPQALIDEAKMEIGIINRYPKLSDNPKQEVAKWEKVIVENEALIENGKNREPWNKQEDGTYIVSRNNEHLFRDKFDPDPSNPQGMFEYDGMTVIFTPNEIISERVNKRENTSEGKIKKLKQELQNKHISQVRQNALEIQPDLPKNLTKAELLDIVLKDYSRELAEKEPTQSKTVEPKSKTEKAEKKETKGKTEKAEKSVEKKPKLTTTDDITPGQGLSIKDIQKKFPNQIVTIGKDNAINVRFKNGLGLKITQINHGKGKDYTYAIQSGRMSENGRILGTYIENKITLDKLLATDFTLTHEVFHFLTENKVVTPADRLLLKNKFNALKRKGKLTFNESTLKDKKIADEENDANMFAQLIKEREQYRNTPIGKLIQKIQDFIDGLLNIGRMSERKLAKEFESGKIYSRETKPGKTQSIKYEQAVQTFYSQLLKSVEAVTQKAMPATQWKQLIKSKGFQAKEEEIEWTGINEWLDNKKGKVTKQEVVDYLNGNQVVIEEVVKGEDDDVTKAEKKIKKLSADLKDFVVGELNYSEETATDLIEAMRDGSPESVLDYQFDEDEVSQNQEKLDSYSTEIYENQRYIDESQDYGNTPQDATKFSRFQLSGGENYKEFFLTLPNIKGHSWQDGHEDYSDIKNPLVRIRANERTVDGKRILVLEEVQGPLKAEVKNMPPWAQKGKNKYLIAMKHMVRYAAENGFDALSWTDGQTQADRYDLSKQVEYIAYSENKDKTYSVIVKPIDSDTALDTISDTSMKNITTEKLEGLIGEEITNKIVQGESDTTTLDENFNELKTLSKESLKVGGEKLISLYDNMLPTLVNKFFNKKAWGKAKVGEIEIKQGVPFEIKKQGEFYSVLDPDGNIVVKNTTKEKAEQFLKPNVKLHSLPITPEMRSKALREGMPLFQTAEPTWTEKFKKWFGKSKVVDEKGEPLGVHHGTKVGGFTTFNIFPAWFSESKKYAAIYTGTDRIFKGVGDNATRRKQEGDMPELYKTHLSLQNPKIFIIKAEQKLSQTEMDRVFGRRDARSLSLPTKKKYLQNKKESKANHDSFGSMFKDKLAFDFTFSFPTYEEYVKEIIERNNKVGVGKRVYKNRVYEYLRHPAWIEDLKNMGHDGIIIIDQGVKTFAAFSPNQIKLTTNRNPTKASPDIRFQTAEDLLSQADKTSGESSIETILSSLKKTVGIKKTKEQKIINAYRELESLTKDPHASIASKQKMLAGFLKVLPEKVRAKVITPLSVISRYKKIETHRKRIDAALSRAEEELSIYLKREIRTGIIKGITPKAIAKNRIKKGTMGHEADRDLKYIRETLKLTDIASSLETIESNIIAKENELQSADEEKIPIIEEEITDLKSKLSIISTFGNLKSQNLDSLLDAKEALASIVDDGRAWWRAKNDAFKAKVDPMVAKAQQDISGQETPTLETAAGATQREAKMDTRWGKIKGTANAVENAIVSFEFLMNKLASKTKDKILKSFLVTDVAEIANEATKEEIIFESKSSDLIHAKAMEIYNSENDKALEKKFLTQSVKQTDKVFSYDEKGKKVEAFVLSQLDAAYWYAVRKDESSIPTFKKMGITDKTFKEIKSFMGPELKTWVDWNVEEHLQDFHFSINEVYRQVNGTNLTKTKGYFTWLREVTGAIDEKGIDSSSYETGVSGLSKGALHERVKNTNRFKVANFNDVLTSHVSDMNNYRAWAIPTKILNSIFNNRKTQKLIEQNHSKQMLSSIKKFQKDFIKSPREMQGELPWLDKLRGNITTAMTALNPTIYLKQLTSIPAMAESIPTKEWIKYSASFWNDPLKAYKTLKDSTGWEERKKMGMERDIRTASAVSGSQAIANVRNLKYKAMFLVRWGDSAAILIGGYPVYKYHFETNKATMGKAKAHQFALTQFENAMNRTQQSSKIKDQGNFMRSGSYAKLFSMFITAPKQYTSQITAAIRQIAKDPKDADAYKRLFIFGILMPSLFQATASGLLGLVGGDDDDEDKFINDQIKAILQAPLNGIPIIRDLQAGIWESAMGEWYGTDVEYSPVAQAGQSLMNAVFHGAKLFSTEDPEKRSKHYRETFNNAFETAGYAYGLPAETMRKMFMENWADIVSGATDYPVRRGLGYSRYVTGEQASRYNRNRNDIKDAIKRRKNKESRQGDSNLLRLNALRKNTETMVRRLKKLKKRATTQKAKDRLQARIETIEKRFNKKFNKMKN